MKIRIGLKNEKNIEKDVIYWDGIGIYTSEGIIRWNVVESVLYDSFDDWIRLSKLEKRLIFKTSGGDLSL